MNKVLVGIILMMIIGTMSGQNFTKDSQSGLYFLTNAKGKPLTQPRYYEVRSFKDGKAWVKDSTGSSVYYRDSTSLGYIYTAKDFGKWGLINKSGKFIIPPTYHFLDTLVNGHFKVGIRQHHYKWIIQDMTKTEPTYEEVPEIPGMTPMGGIKREYDYARSPMYYGLLDKNGHEVLPIKYYNVGYPMSDYVLIDRGKEPENQRPLILLRRKPSSPPLGLTRFVLIHIKDGNVIPLNYDYIYEKKDLIHAEFNYGDDIKYTFSNLPEFYILEKIKEDTTFYGVMGADGHLIAPAVYYNAVEENLNYMPDPNDPETIVDTHVISYRFPLMMYDSLTDQHFLFLSNNEVNRPIILSSQGEILFQGDQQYTLLSFKDRALLFGRNQYYNTEKGKELENEKVSTPRWTFYPFAEHATFPKPNYNEVFDRLNAFKPQANHAVSYLFKEFYSQLTPRERNIFWVKQDNFYGLCDSSGNYILPPDYVYIDSFISDDDMQIFSRRVMYTGPHFQLNMETGGEFLFHAYNTKYNYRNEWILLNPDNSVKKIWYDVADILYDGEKQQYKILGYDRSIQWFK